MTDWQSVPDGTKPLVDRKPMAARVSYRAVSDLSIPFRRDISGSHKNLIAVAGLSGSTGRTLLVVNLACALAEQGVEVAILDAELQFGDVGFAFALPADAPTSLNLAGILGSGHLRSSLAQPCDGIWVLPAPPEPSLADEVDRDRMLATAALASEQFGVVLVDTPPFFGGLTDDFVRISGLTILIDSIGERGNKNLGFALNYLEVEQLALQCLVVRNRVSGGDFGTDGMAIAQVEAGAQHPAWPVLPRVETLGEASQWLPESLMLRAEPGSMAYVDQVWALADRIVTEL